MQNNQRLAWACRRGMLELDVLLGNFLREAYPTLTPADQALFANLLNYGDPDLADWLMGANTPEDKDLAHIVKMIRDHAHARSHL